MNTLFILLFFIVLIVAVSMIMSRYDMSNAGIDDDVMLGEESTDGTFVEGLVNIDPNQINVNEWDIDGMLAIHASPSAKSSSGVSMTIKPEDMGEYIQILASAKTPTGQSIYPVEQYDASLPDTVMQPINSTTYTNMGTFNDRDNRVLPIHLGRVGNNKDCQERAKRGGFKMYGTQYNGECFAAKGSDEDARRAVQYGKSKGDYNNGQPGRMHGTGNPDMGGSWDHVLYSTVPVTIPGEKRKKYRFIDYGGKVGQLLTNNLSTIEAIRSISQARVQAGFTTIQEGLTSNVVPSGYTQLANTNINGATSWDPMDARDIVPQCSAKCNDTANCGGFSIQGRQGQWDCWTIPAAGVKGQTDNVYPENRLIRNLPAFTSFQRTIPVVNIANQMNPQYVGGTTTPLKQGFTTVLEEGLTPQPTLANRVTDKINASFKITNSNAKDITQFFNVNNTYNAANGIDTAEFTRRLNALYGIRSSSEYNNLVKSLSPSLGVIEGDMSGWMIDILPAYFGVKNKQDLDYMKSILSKYRTFGFGPPALNDGNRHQRYCWYGVQLSKIGVQVREFANFSTIHVNRFGIKMDMASKPNSSVNVNNDNDVLNYYNKDVFLNQCMPAYLRMGFTYRVDTTSEPANATAFRGFCATVNTIAGNSVPQKLNNFANILGKYAMPNYLVYMKFNRDYLSKKVGYVGDLSTIMTDIKTYLFGPSKLDMPEVYQRLKIDANAKYKDVANKNQPVVLNYRVAEWFINKLGETQSYNLNTDGNFGEYMKSLIANKYSFHKAVKSNMIQKDAKYSQFENKKRHEAVAQPSYQSIVYDRANDPSTIAVTEGFESSMLGSIGDNVSEWIMRLFESTKEGLQNDNDVLASFGVNNGHAQLPEIMRVFEAYGVTNFEEVIFYITALSRIGCNYTNLVNDTPPCLSLLKKYRIDKTRLDVFCRYMANMRMTSYGDVKDFMEVTMNYGVNKTEINYKQFLFYTRVMGCDISNRSNRQFLYTMIKYFGKMNNYTDAINKGYDFAGFTGSGYNASSVKMVNEYISLFKYHDKRDNLKHMNQQDSIEMKHYAFDNFASNMQFRGFTLNRMQDEFPIMPSMFAGNTMFDDMLIINRLPPLLPYNKNNKKMIQSINPLFEQYLQPLMKNQKVKFPTMRGISQFIRKMIATNPDRSGKMDERDVCIKIMNYSVIGRVLRDTHDRESMMNVALYLNPDEYLLFGNLKKIEDIYTKENFNSVDKIVRFMIDIACGMELHSLDIFEMKGPEEKRKIGNYNDGLDQINSLRLFPIFMFRRLVIACMENAKMYRDHNNPNTENLDYLKAIKSKRSKALHRPSYVAPHIKL
jgi:hypothetical protein